MVSNPSACKVTLVLVIALAFVLVPAAAAGKGKGGGGGQGGGHKGGGFVPTVFLFMHGPMVQNANVADPSVCIPVAGENPMTTSPPTNDAPLAAPADFCWFSTVPVKLTSSGIVVKFTLQQTATGVIAPDFGATASLLTSSGWIPVGSSVRDEPGFTPLPTPERTLWIPASGAAVGATGYLLVHIEEANPMACDPPAGSGCLDMCLLPACGELRVGQYMIQTSRILYDSLEFPTRVVVVGTDGYGEGA